MMHEALSWALERVRKGVEFEVEGGIFRAGAEYAPHACATALGCSLVQAQVGTVAICGGALVVILVVRRYRKRSQPSGWSDCGKEE